MGVTIDPETEKFVIETVEGTFELQNQACQGIQYKDGFEVGHLNDMEARRELKGTQNDLSAFVFKSYLEGEMSLEQTELYEETVVGYKKPEIQNNDNKRENACREAFEERCPGMEYEVKA